MSREADRVRDEVVERRRDVEHRMTELRTSINRETGVLPKAKYTLMALAAGAVGLTLAARRQRKKKRRH